MKQTLPRGLRNNNPGNIRRSKDNWQGLAPEQTDPDFFQFTAPEWGYRALIKTLQTYRKPLGTAYRKQHIGLHQPRVPGDAGS